MLDRYGEKTVAIYIGGSRVHNLETPISDYDITIIVDDDIAYEISMPHCFLKYKETLAHWYYLPLKTILSSTRTQDMYDLMMPTTLQALKKNPTCLLYFNDKYSRVFDTIVSEFEGLRNEWYTFIFNSYKEAIQRYVLGLPVKPGDKRLTAKKLYFLCLCSCLLRNETPNKDFLTELKLTKMTRQLSTNCREYIKETLVKFEEATHHYPSDLTEAIMQAEEKIQNELRNLHK